MPSRPVAVRKRNGPSVTLLGCSRPSSRSRLHGESKARNITLGSPTVPLRSSFRRIFSTVPFQLASHSPQNTI